jgi:hypothetical protein
MSKALLLLWSESRQQNILNWMGTKTTMRTEGVPFIHILGRADYHHVSHQSRGTTALESPS